MLATFSGCVMLVCVGSPKLGLRLCAVVDLATLRCGYSGQRGSGAVVCRDAGPLKNGRKRRCRAAQAEIRVSNALQVAGEDRERGDETEKRGLWNEQKSAEETGSAWIRRFASAQGMEPENRGIPTQNTHTRSTAQNTAAAQRFAPATRAPVSWRAGCSVAKQPTQGDTQPSRRDDAACATASLGAAPIRSGRSAKSVGSLAFFAWPAACGLWQR